jgi:hypothetical protein
MPPPKTLKRKRSSSSTSSPFNLNNYIESTKEVDEVLGPQSQAHKKPKRVKVNPRTKRYRKTRKSGPNPPHSPEFTNTKTVHKKRYGLDLRKDFIFSSSPSSPQDDPALDDYNLGLPGTRKKLKKEKKNPQLDDLKSSSNEDSYSPNSSNSPKPRLSQSPLSRRLKP